MAADIGTALGGGAHLRCLRRTNVGSFRADVGTTLDESLGSQTLLSAEAAMLDYPSAIAGGDLVGQIRNGRVVPYDLIRPSALRRQPGTPEVWSVLTEEGELLAVYERFRDDLAKPAVVLPERGK